MAIVYRPIWRFVLCNSVDLSRIGELKQATGRKLSVLADKPGKADFTYPMNARYAATIEKYKTGIIAERFNWRASLAWQLAGHAGEVWDQPWSGYVQMINEDWANNKMTISCPGWLQRLQTRMTRSDMSWNTTDDGLIIRDIIQSLNGNPSSPSYEMGAGVTSYGAGDGYSVRWPSGSVPNTSTWIKWGGTQPNEGPGGSTAYVSAMRNYKLPRYSFALPTIDQIVNIENGCDIHLHPMTRELTVHRRYRRVKDDVVIGFQWGPRNASSFDRTLDGDREVNYFLAQGDAGVTPQFAHDLSRVDQIGLIEEVQQVSGINDPATLLAFAGAEIVIRSNGLVTYGITPFSYTSENSIPEPFVDYREGDQIRITAKHPPRGNILNQAVRLFGLNVNIDDSGNETLEQLQVAP